MNFFIPITPATTGPVPMPTWICRRALRMPESASMYSHISVAIAQIALQ